MIVSQFAQSYFIQRRQAFWGILSYITQTDAAAWRMGGLAASNVQGSTMSEQGSEFTKSIMKKRLKTTSFNY